MRFSCLDYFFNVLVSWSRRPSLYDLICLYSILSILPVLYCFLSLGDNSGYMNSGYSDIRYRVYTWGFPCSDYSFNVLISRIDSLGLYNGFCHIYVTWCLIACSCASVLMSWFSIQALWLGFIDTCVLLSARYLALIWPLLGQLSDFPVLACSDPKAWTLVNFQLIRVAQR